MSTTFFVELIPKNKLDSNRIVKHFDQSVEWDQYQKQFESSPDYDIHAWKVVSSGYYDDPNHNPFPSSLD